MKIIEDAIKLGACEKAKDVKDLQSLAKLFFSPQGREFCLKNNYPDLEAFRSLEDAGKYNVFIDRGVEKNNEDIALINSHGKLKFNNPNKPYLVILMHGASAEINIENYSVVRIEGIGATVKKDKTSVVLW